MTSRFSAEIGSRGVREASAGPALEIVAQNRFESVDSDFNGTPAISGGRLVLRWDRALYCEGGSGG